MKKKIALIIALIMIIAPMLMACDIIFGGGGSETLNPEPSANERVAQAVVRIIDNLPVVPMITIDDEDAIAYARERFNALTLLQKDYISAVTLLVLLDAEKRISYLRGDFKIPECPICLDPPECPICKNPPECEHCENHVCPVCPCDNCDEESYYPYDPIDPELPSPYVGDTFPVIRIETSHGGSYPFGLNRRDWHRSTITIENTHEIYEMQNISIDMRGRGNSTWGLFYGSKQPFRIRFDGSAGTTQTERPSQGRYRHRYMLDSPHASRNWSFIANHMDSSLMRNEVAFHLGHQMDSIQFTPFTRFVHLYINGYYRGVYVLSDHMDIDNRVDIVQNNDPALTEFYLEFDQRIANPVYNPGFADPFFVVGGMPFDFRADLPSDATLRQQHVDEAQGFIQSLHDAILSRNWTNIAPLIDVDSWVDFYLIQELMKQQDIAWSSVHMTVRFIDGVRKLQLGPLWDFDISLGNTYYAFEHNPTGYWPDGRQVALHHPWFRNLVHYVPEFRILVQERFIELRDEFLPNTIDYINYMAERFESEFQRNFDRWENLDTFTWPNPTHLFREVVTFRNHVKYIEWFLNVRIQWMEYYLGLSSSFTIDRISWRDVLGLPQPTLPDWPYIEGVTPWEVPYRHTRIWFYNENNMWFQPRVHAWIGGYDILSGWWNSEYRNMTREYGTNWWFFDVPRRVPYYQFWILIHCSITADSNRARAEHMQITNTQYVFIRYIGNERGRLYSSRDRE
ncbi:MAG: CotH kinase family protein [Firmicutes bacterium]|nr:CotH kinase family protein [Bacillota bacterium]